jgi:hypothetical protein
MYSRVDTLLWLVVTLLVSTETTRRASLAMKLVKTRLQNKTGDGFIWNYMIIYIEKELTTKISSHDIIEAFDLVCPRRGKFKLIEM